jgi:hypothetical protein
VTNRPRSPCADDRCVPIVPGVDILDDRFDTDCCVRCGRPRTHRHPPLVGKVVGSNPTAPTLQDPLPGTGYGTAKARGPHSRAPFAASQTLDRHTAGPCQTHRPVSVAPGGASGWPATPGSPGRGQGHRPRTCGNGPNTQGSHRRALPGRPRRCIGPGGGVPDRGSGARHTVGKRKGHSLPNTRQADQACRDSRRERGSEATERPKGVGTNGNPTKERGDVGNACGRPARLAGSHRRGIGLDAHSGLGIPDVSDQGSRTSHAIADQATRVQRAVLAAECTEGGTSSACAEYARCPRRTSRSFGLSTPPFKRSEAA